MNASRASSQQPLYQPLVDTFEVVIGQREVAVLG